MLKLSKFILAFSSILIGMTSSGFSQETDYLFPINPGQTNFLAGTMGELRSSHFHAGIDIKTGGREGLNVLAAKRGYISRIKISTSGYGNALYMLHPDGNTTVYAHLQQFEPELQAWVKSQQYEKESFEIELFPKAYQFAYDRGEVIGVSGNTGGSTGPHLHFEIRDDRQRVLNPLHFGFNEIKDNIPPTVQSFAIRPMSERTRINGLNQRYFPKVTRNGSNYSIQDTIRANGLLGLELRGHDKLNGAANQNGISKIEVYINDERYYLQNIDSMYFSTQRHILVHYPYDLKMQGLGRFHKLYVDDGNKLRFYHPTQLDGLLALNPGDIYRVHIKMYDPYKNMSTLELTIKGGEFDAKLEENIDFEIDDMAYTIDGKYLKAYVHDKCLQTDDKLSLYVNQAIMDISPKYYQKDIAVYTYDLSEGVPQSISSCNQIQKIAIDAPIYPGEEKLIEHKQFDLRFSEYSVFDTAYVDLNYELVGNDSLEVFSVEPITIPLKSPIYFTVKPQRTYNASKASVYQLDDNGNFYFEGGEWKSASGISFSTRSMGSYTILEDDVAPSIERLNNSLRFIIQDDLSGIKSYTATLNGEWVLMKYEPKENIIWVDWPDDRTNRTGEFKLIVKDQVDNTAELIINL